MAPEPTKPQDHGARTDPDMPGDMAVFPASFTQQRLWFLSQYAAGAPVYHVPQASRLRGPLHTAALEASLAALVLRHEILRTTFKVSGTDVVQVIHPRLRIPLTVIDLKSLPAAECEAEVRARLREEARRLFDLEHGPLLRCTLLQLAPHEHVLLIVLHHIVADGWALGVFNRELGALYGQICAGQTPQLPELPIQYADFAVWQREWLTGDVVETLAAYWRTKLAGPPPALDLPADRPRPALDSFRGAREFASLGREVSIALAALAKAERTTLFMVLLASLKALFHRYTGQEDILIGTPIANRTRAEVEGLIGCFLNTLALRTDLSGDPTFRDLLARVRETALDAYDHQDLPFEKLLDLVPTERSPNRTPLFQVMFALQNFGDRSLVLAGLTVEPLPFDLGVALFDLTVFAYPQGDAVDLVLEYSTDLFDQERIRRLLGHWEMLLAGIVANPAARLSELPLLTDAERRQVLVEWNRTAVDYPRDKCVHELFEEQAARTPDAVAVEFGDQRLTYAELNRRANQLAHHLHGLGVGPDVPVGLCVERSIEMLVALLGILKAGGAYLPLDPGYPSSRLRLAVVDSQAPLVVTSRALRERTQWLGKAQALVLEELPPGLADRNPGFQVGSRNLAYVLYTSGSTGRPKGVAVEHRSVVNLLHALPDLVGVDRNDAVMAVTTLSFDIAVVELLLPLVIGSRVLLASDAVRADPTALAAELEKRGGTVLQATPATWRLLQADDWAGKSGLTALCGGEALPRDLADWLGERCARLWNLYGPTETTVYSTAGDVRPGQRIMIGAPMPNTRLYVVDPHGSPVPVGIPGELWIGGDGVARGYLNQPELTAERFISDPFSWVPGARLYRTGDRVRWRADGQLEFLGRLDQQVKIRGFRVELEEVEAVLRGCTGVRECAVAVRGEGGDKRLVGYVAPEPGERCRAEVLRDHLRGQLPEYMVPSAFVFIEKLPLSPNGKVDRRALPELSSEPTRPVPEVTPRNPTEELLAAIWCQVLDAEHVGVRENFFDLGGHSLLIFRLITRIREVLGVELPVHAVFETPTVEALCRVIERLHSDAAPSPAPSLSPRHTVEAPASFIQEGLWFLHGCAPESAVYNANFIWRIEGALDARALGSAVAEVVRRHAALRTRFEVRDGSVWQIVAPPGPAVMLIQDLAEPGPSEREAALRQRLETEASCPFDLCHGPVFRARLLRLQPEEHFLFIGVHHIVFDEWSANVLKRELGELYEAYSQSRPPNLPEPTVQYADFAWRERQRWETGEMRGHLDYWRSQFPEVPPAMGLPTDHPRPKLLSFRGNQETRLLDARLSRDLKALSGREGTTLFMTLLAGFFALLHRYTGQDDLVVGMPITMRSGPETEVLIGHFVNTVAARADLSGDPSFEELLHKIRTVCLGAYAHRECPLGRLAADLRLPRAANRSPLCDVMFVLLNADQASLDLPGLGVQPVRLPGANAKFDLTLFMEDTPAGLRTMVECASDLFERATIHRLLGHWEMLLAGIVANPAARLSELPLLTDAERRQVLVAWNNTAVDYPRDKCVHELFEEQAARTPDAVAVEFGDQRLTYAELNGQADRVARCLSAQRVEPDDLIGFCVARSPAMVAGLLGVLKAGGAYWPVDTDLPARRLELLLADARPKLLLVDQRDAGRVAALTARAAAATGAAPPPVVTIEALLNDAPPAAIPAARRSRPADLAYVMYTSGSTGRPKGVMVPHRAVVRLVRGANYVSLTPRETLLHLAPLSFDASSFELWGALLNGSRVVLMPPGQPSLTDIGQAIRERGVSTLWLTAGLFHLMVDERLADLKPLRQLLSGGDVLSVEHVRKAFRALPACRLVNGYGPTENTTFTCCHTVVSEDQLVPSVPIGRPIANTRVYVLDARLQPVPVGVPGELYAGGDGVARGYLNEPDLTAERFIPDLFSHVPGARLYRTGDRVRWRADGQLEFLGRLDQQVKIRGFRVELEEVEAVLRGCTGVRECAVAVRGEGGDKRLVGYVAPEPGETCSAEAWRDHLRGQLPEYMVPSAFVLIEKLPLKPNGKVDRGVLPAPGVTTLTASQPDGAPRNRLELELLRVWERLTHHKGISRHDNFFDLGGHSLLAAQLMAEVENLAGCRLPVAALFQAPTVELLARMVSEEDWAPAWGSLVPLQPEGARPPFFFVHGWGGDVFCFLDLARLLGPDQPSYGIQAVGLRDLPARHRTVEEMAAHYVQEILAFQPAGPYYLGGYSLGGLIAFEMARQLQAKGRPVGMLALIDAHVVCLIPWARYAKPVLRHLFGRLMVHAGRWLSMPLRERAGYIRGRWAALPHYLQRNRHHAPPDNTPLPGQPSRPNPGGGGEYYQELVANYRVAPFPGKAELFLSDTAKVGLAATWERYLRGGVTTHRIPGNHREIMDGDHVHGLATVFRLALQAAQERAGYGEKLR